MLLPQENWVQILRPRSSDIKFKLPYHGPCCYNYLDGKLAFQLFGKQSTSEVRLVVDAPSGGTDCTAGYARRTFNRQEHDDCMFYHNFVTRMEHMDSDAKIKLSYDQHAAHDIIKDWVHHAKTKENMSEQTIAMLLQDLDGMYESSLALQFCPQLRERMGMLPLDIHKEQEFVGGSYGEYECGAGTEATHQQRKVQMQRLWKKNMNVDIEKKRLKNMESIRQQAAGPAACSSMKPHAYDGCKLMCSPQADAMKGPEQEADAMKGPEQEADAMEDPEQEADAMKGPEQEADAMEDPEQEADAMEDPEQEADAME